MTDDIVAFTLVLLTVWLGVMDTCVVKCVLLTPRNADLVNSTSSGNFLEFILTLSEPAIQDKICCQEERSATSVAMQSEQIPSRNILFKEYKSMHDHRNFRPNQEGYIPTNPPVGHHTSEAVRRLLELLKPSNDQHKVTAPQSAVSTETFPDRDVFSKHSIDPAFTFAAIPSQRAIIKSPNRTHECREIDVNSRNVRCIKCKIFNTRVSASSKTYNCLNLIVYLRSTNSHTQSHNITPTSLSYPAKVLHFRRKIEQFLLGWSTKCCLTQTEKLRKSTRRNENFWQAKVFPVHPTEVNSRAPFNKVKSLLFNKRGLFHLRQLKSLSNAVIKAFILGKCAKSCPIFHDHIKRVSIDCYLRLIPASRSYSSQRDEFDLSQNLPHSEESKLTSSTESTEAVDSTLHTLSQNHHVHYLPLLPPHTPVLTKVRRHVSATEANIPTSFEPSSSASMQFNKQQNNKATDHTTPHPQTRIAASSRHMVRRSDWINSRRKSRLGGVNTDGSSPVSNSRDTYGLYHEPSSSFPSWETATPSPQPLSLKVVVHLSINRGYERVLDSAITTGLRELFQVTKLLAPSGKLVKLRGDKPRDILQAFCDDILEPNTTAVFHLVNPFFHTRSWSSAQYVANLLSTLDMPIITWGPEYIGTTDKKESELLQLNISPTLYHQAQAMLEVLHHYNWTYFCVVYTPVPGHDVFITAVRILVNDNNSHVRKNGFKYGIVDQVEVSNASDRNAIIKDLKVLTRTEARIILLYCMEGDTLNIIQEATRLGLVTDEYLWFLTFEAVNKNRQMNANNLPLGLLGIYYEYREEEMEQAIKTAVAVWFRGLIQSVTASDGEVSGLQWSLPNFECQSSTSLIWKDGPTFYDIMRNVSFENVAFNELGQLKIKDISIVNIQPPVVGEEDQKWRQVGKYTADGIQMRHITWPGETIHPPLGRPKRHLLRIVTREEPPFVEYREVNKNGTCGHFSYICHVYQRDENEVRVSNATVKRCCTGLSIDFLHRLSQSLNFEFYLYEVEDYQWGSENSEGIWDGIVGDLRSGRADMAVASMTIDEDRSSGIDFSVPYMETGITFMVAIREGAISATAFLEPYDYPSWCLILLCSVHITGTSIFFFEWFSPNGLDHGRRLSSNHRFSLFRTFWLMWAMLFGAAVTTDSPRGVSSKFVSNIWALFALVFSASYTANLAAFMITKEEYFDLSGMQDWRLQNPYAMNPAFRFATIPNGTTESNIKKNNYWMYEYMKKYSQRSVEQAMESLKRQKLHAFIYDASVLEYQEGKDKDCKLITVGNWYSTTGFGVGLPFGSPWLERVNNVILNLQSEGEMERLKEFWLAGACHTKRKKNTNNRGIGNGVSSTTLGILNFTSAFIFLAAGTGLAILTFILEYLYFWFGRERLSSWDKKGCCALISLSMGMSLSFQKSVREAWDIHRKSRHKCTSPVCETGLWKANHELRLARGEISRLQAELARARLDSSVVWKYDPASTTKPDVSDLSMWDCENSTRDYRDEEEAVRVTLL